MQAFDFEEWAELYRKSPAEFEARRQAVLEQMIAGSPLAEERKAKLRATLFDASAAGKDPMESVLRAQRLMWEAFTELQDQLKSLHVSANQDGTVSVRKTAVSQFTA